MWNHDAHSKQNDFETHCSNSRSSTVRVNLGRNLKYKKEHKNGHFVNISNKAKILMTYNLLIYKWIKGTITKVENI